MKIDKLSLRFFRNYEKLDLKLHPSLNFFYGENGAGKTNILESLVFASNLHSFRCTRNEEMIKKGYDSARIDISCYNKSLRVILSKIGKSLYLNSNIITKSSLFLGELNCLLFKPADIYLFEDSPKSRRLLLNIEISKVSNEYLQNLLLFEKLLKEKNALLKKEKIDELYLSLLEEKMVCPIYTIMSYRQNFIAFINTHLSEYFKRLSGLSSSVEIVYKNVCELDKEIIRQEIKKNKIKEKEFRFTLFGPHKEDLEARINKFPLESYASQGQKRLYLLALKLAIYEYVCFYKKEAPLILLDDILSELDKENRYRLFSTIPKNAQVIITSCNKEKIQISDYKEIKIKEGFIYE